MNKRGSADKIKLSSFDDLFGTQEAGTGTEQVQEIPLCELHEFRGHPFKVVDQRCDEIEKCTWCFSKIGVYLCTAHVISLDNSR